MSIANFDSQNYIKCKLEMTSKSENFYPGETVAGVMTANCTKNVYFYGFQVCLIGNAIVKFTNPGSEEQNEDSSIFCKETLILGNPIFYEPNVTKKKYLLTPGQYKFPFDFQLPKNELPCSFETPSGIIRYQVIGLTRDDAGPYRKTAAKVHLRPLPLSLSDPRLSIPFSVTKSESTFFGKPQLSITIEASKSVFYQKEMVPFKISIFNSTKGISKTTIIFSQRTVYKSKSESKIANKDYITLEHEGDNEWIETIEFPAKLVPTQFGGFPCPRMELSYFFKIEVRMKKPVKMIKAEIPIVIVCEPRIQQQREQIKT